MIAFVPETALKFFGAVILVPEGLAVGFTVGFAVALAVGLAVGLTVGFTVGFAVGLAVGLTVGEAVGFGVFVAAGAGVHYLLFSFCAARTSNNNRSFSFNTW